MFEIFQYWQVNLLIAVCFFVVMQQYYRLLAQIVKDIDSIPIIIGGMIGSAVFILLMPFFEMKFSTDWRVYGLLFLASIFYVAQDLLKARSYKHLNISINSILFQSSKIFLIIFGILFFGESLGGSEILGIVSILVGVTIVTIDRRNFVINKYA